MYRCQCIIGVIFRVFPFTQFSSYGRNLNSDFGTLKLQSQNSTNYTTQILLRLLEWLSVDNDVAGFKLQSNFKQVRATGMFASHLAIPEPNDCYAIRSDFLLHRSLFNDNLILHSDGPFCQATGPVRVHDARAGKASSDRLCRHLLFYLNSEIEVRTVSELGQCEIFRERWIRCRVNL